MKTLYLVNAFSLQMLTEPDVTLKVTEMNEEQFKKTLPHVTSAVGHEDTANILGVEKNRMDVTLKDSETIIVAQIQGGRLPEGSTTLPDGYSFKYYSVYASSN